MSTDVPFGIGTIINWSGYSGAVWFVIVLGAVIACLGRRFRATLCLVITYGFIQDYWGYFAATFYGVTFLVSIIVVIASAVYHADDDGECEWETVASSTTTLASMLILMVAFIDMGDTKFSLADAVERRDLVMSCFANKKTDVDVCRDMLEWTPNVPVHIVGIAEYQGLYGRRDANEGWGNFATESNFRSSADQLNEKILPDSGMQIVEERDFWQGLAFFSWNTEEGFSKAAPLFQSSGEPGLWLLSSYFSNAANLGSSKTDFVFSEKIAQTVGKGKMTREELRDYVISLARNRLHMPFYKTDKVTERVVKMSPEARHDWRGELDWLCLVLLASYWSAYGLFLFIPGMYMSFFDSEFYKEWKAMREREGVIKDARSVSCKKLVPPLTLKKLNKILAEWEESEKKVPKLAASLEKLKTELLTKENALLKEAEAGSKRQKLDGDIAASFQAMSEDLTAQKSELSGLIAAVEEEIRIRAERMPLLFGFLKQVSEQAKVYPKHDQFTREAMQLQKEIKTELEEISK